MKLNYKRTIFVGFAFFLICAFWQAYDTIIPKILTDKFGMSQTLSGVIMAADNVLALFLLPLFGTISDKCKSKRGRRTPFIIFGTVAAAVLFVALSFADDMQIKYLAPVAVDNPTAQETLYDADLMPRLRTMMPPAAPMRFMTALALLLSGLMVTSGMSATAGLRKVAMLSSTSSSMLMNRMSGARCSALIWAA